MSHPWDDDDVLIAAIQVALHSPEGRAWCRAHDRDMRQLRLFRMPAWARTNSSRRRAGFRATKQLQRRKNG
jgi:hypothetical protein